MLNTKTTTTKHSLGAVGAALMLATTLPAVAQHDDHNDHGMPHAPSDAPAHGAMQHEMDHSSHDTTQPEPPTGLRDPQAYADGYGFGPFGDAHGGTGHTLGALFVDRLEAVDASRNSFVAYDGNAWYGNDYDRALVKAKGRVESGELKEAGTELLWSHAVAPFWNSQLGIRYDSGEGADRSWIAFGLTGIAPYWFDVDATVYVGEKGHSALALETDYEMLVTQNLILQPRAEAQWFGKDDPEREIGSGLAEIAAGLRLRYEIAREFAPYVGLEWVGKYGGTAEYARTRGDDSKETRGVAGLRFWF